MPVARTTSKSNSENIAIDVDATTTRAGKDRWRGRFAPSAEEREAARAKRELNQAYKLGKTAWEATLPAAQKDTVQHPSGAHVLIKSEAKRLFGLTDRELATLPVDAPSKNSGSYYLFVDVRALYERKLAAGAVLPARAVDATKTVFPVLRLVSGAGSKKPKFMDLRMQGVTLEQYDRMLMLKDPKTAGKVEAAAAA